jgi:hypothetical protein
MYVLAGSEENYVWGNGDVISDGYPSIFHSVGRIKLASTVN